MFMSVVVNKQYSTGGKDAVPLRSCMGTLGSGVSCLSFWKPPHLLFLITYDSAPKQAQGLTVLTGIAPSKEKACGLPHIVGRKKV